MAAPLARAALQPGAQLLLLRLCALALLLGGAHAGCPGAAAPGYSCAGSVETQCPVGSYCAGGGAAAAPCMIPANCGVAGLRVEPPCVWNVTTLAGSGGKGYADGQGTAAVFNDLAGVAADDSGVVYVADSGNYRIRTVTPSGLVSTLAGRNVAWADGTGVAAGFRSPRGVATYPGSGIIYVADSSDNRIRKLTPSGVTTTFAGSGNLTWADGQGTSASFFNPSGLSVDSAGMVYVADTYNNHIRKITPLGAVTTLAGTGIFSPFYYPYGVTVDKSGNVYVGDTFNNRIRLILPNGTVSTLAGSGTATWADGTGTSAAFGGPRHLSFVANGNLLVVDSAINRIRMITPLGVVTTLLGQQPGFQDGIWPRFYSPYGISVTSDGALVIGDSVNNRVRRAVCTVCLSGDCAAISACPPSFFCSSGIPITCTPGSFCPSNSLLPTPCPPGTYSPTTGATSSAVCTTCPIGSFCPSATAQPYPCAAGYYGSSAGASTSTCTGPCSAPPGFGCPAGSTSPAGALQCTPGSFCPGGTPAPAIPCLTPANCGAVGLSAEPPCVWNVTTLAGNGSSTFADGQGYCGFFQSAFWCGG